MNVKRITLVLVLVLVALCGCTEPIETSVGNADITANTDQVTLDEGEEETITFTVSSDSYVEWVAFNVTDTSENIEAYMVQDSAQPGESVDLVVQSHDTVETYTTVMPCGQAMCPQTHRDYDDKSVTVSVTTSSGASDAITISVKA